MYVGPEQITGAEASRLVTKTPAMALACVVNQKRGTYRRRASQAAGAKAAGNCWLRPLAPGPYLLPRCAGTARRASEHSSLRSNRAFVRGFIVGGYAEG
jgi:hypothetical protein